MRGLSAPALDTRLPVTSPACPDIRQSATRHEPQGNVPPEFSSFGQCFPGHVLPCLQALGGGEAPTLKLKPRGAFCHKLLVTGWYFLPWGCFPSGAWRFHSANVPKGLLRCWSPQHPLLVGYSITSQGIHAYSLCHRKGSICTRQNLPVPVHPASAADAQVFHRVFLPWGNAGMAVPFQ